MYQKHFGLHREPFALGPNLRFLYQSRAHAEAMAHLGYGLEQGEDLILIVGVIGTGKTLALQNLQVKVSRLFRQVLINVTNVSFPEFLKLALHELGQTWPPDADRADLLCLLRERAQAIHAEGQKILLVVDEAQNLDADTLEGIRLLANLGQPTRQLFQIVLAGQPKLAALIEQPELAQLRQRIRIHYNLEPLSAAETVEYIAHRLAVAGRTEPLFTAQAAARIHELSGGIPRLVNHLAGNALLTAFVAAARKVEVQHVAAEGMPETPAQPVVAPTPPAAAPAPPPVAAASQLSEPAPQRLTMRPRAAAAQAGRRRPGWVWVWLVLVVVIAAGMIYLFKDDLAKRPALLEAERLMPAPGGPAGGQAEALTDVAEAAPSSPRPAAPAEPTASVEAAVKMPASDEAPGAMPPGEAPAVAQQAPVRREEPAAFRSTASLASGHWLHVASFREPERAARQHELLAAGGCPVMVREVVLNDRETWFRIMLGPYQDRASAEAAAAAYRERGLITFHRVMVY